MKKSKAGFTLVELMVVAAIIAILAAIIIPLLASNRDSAIASEAANICSMAATEAKIAWAKSGDWPSTAELPTQTKDEIDNAKYFNLADLTLNTAHTPTAYSILVTGGAGEFSIPGAHTLTLDQDGQWGGTMVANGWIRN